MKRFIPLLLVLLVLSGCVVPNVDWNGTGSRSGNPFKGQKELNVLVVDDQPRRGALPDSQRLIFSAPKIREYVLSKGGQIRFYPEGADLSKDSPHFAEAYKTPRQKLPWIAVGKGSKGTTQDLPQSIDDTLTLLQKYGGK